GSRWLRLPSARGEGEDGPVHSTGGARLPGLGRRAARRGPPGLRQRGQRGGRQSPAGGRQDPRRHGGLADAHRDGQRDRGAPAETRPQVPPGVRHGGRPGARRRPEQRDVPGLQPGP
ncbi:hypothetical protein CRUP_027512, partial [Coryphaenoides rupestris]